MQALPDDDAQSQRAIAWAVALTTREALGPGQYEQQLLASYQRAELSVEQVLSRLDTRVQHVLYRSQARQPQAADELTTLVEQSRAWNQDKQITGLLCYSSPGHFVQVLEGTAREVHALFARIQLDKRHYHVQALSDCASATRWFADWQMVLMEPADSYWLLGQAEARRHKLVKPQIPISSPALLTLLQAFSRI